MHISLLNYWLCGAFVFVPIITIVIGIKLITRFVGFKNKLSTIIVALLIGIVFLEASAIGMLADPRSTLLGVVKIIKLAGLVGLAVFLLVLFLGPVYVRVLQFFKH
jgi:hypothetical protein